MLIHDGDQRKLKNLWIEGLAVETGHDQTVLVGQVQNQAHLYGLLDRIAVLAWNW